MIDLSGKRALVTGASRGIGAATARLLGSLGADVAIGYRSRAEDAEQVAQETASFHGRRVLTLAADITDPRAVEGMFAEIDSAWGSLHLFIGNAGIWPVEDVPLAEMQEERWSETMRQNVDSMFLTTRAAARRLGRGGRIVLVASTAGQRGEAYHSDYAASKGAMISFVKSLALELAPNDITVNCVAPGWVDTEMCADAFSNGGRERIEAAIPLGRIASPEDIAGPIAFLCSDLARHVTGEVLNVNGGSVLCG